MQTINVTSIRGACVTGVGKLPCEPTVCEVFVRISDDRQIAVSPRMVREMAEALGYIVKVPKKVA